MCINAQEGSRRLHTKLLTSGEAGGEVELGLSKGC